MTLLDYIEEYRAGVAKAPRMYGDHPDVGYLYCLLLVVQMCLENEDTNPVTAHQRVNITHRRLASEILGAKGPKAADYWPDNDQQFRELIEALATEVLT